MNAHHANAYEIESDDDELELVDASAPPRGKLHLTGRQTPDEDTANTTQRQIVPAAEAKALKLTETQAREWHDSLIAPVLSTYPDDSQLAVSIASKNYAAEWAVASDVDALIRIGSRSPINCYPQVSLSSASAAKRGKRGDQAEALPMYALVVDLDTSRHLEGVQHRGNSGKTGLPLPSDEYVLEAAAHLAAMAQVALIDTGGGYHLWVPLERPLKANTSAKTPEAVATLAGWKRYWMNKMSGDGFHVDAGVLADVVRILRLPGSWRWKGEKALDESGKKTGKQIWDPYVYPVDFVIRPDANLPRRDAADLVAELLATLPPPAAKPAKSTKRAPQAKPASSAPGTAVEPVEDARAGTQLNETVTVSEMIAAIGFKQISGPDSKGQTHWVGPGSTSREANTTVYPPDDDHLCESVSVFGESPRGMLHLAEDLDTDQETKNSYTPFGLLIHLCHGTDDALRVLERVPEHDAFLRYITAHWETPAAGLSKPLSPTTWTPIDRTRLAWGRQANPKDHAAGRATETNRVWALLDAGWWAVRYAGQVYAVQRSTIDRPTTGGILRLAGGGAWIANVARTYGELSHETCKKQSIRDAVLRWEGSAQTLDTVAYTRWGVGFDNSLWWDSGRQGGGLVRISHEGWEVRFAPECWFIRPSSFEPLPMPEGGGSLTELWRFANINPEDRRLVTSWLLAAMMAGRKTAAGMLYLHGPAGSGKTSGASRLAEAAGSDANLQTQRGSAQSDQDRAAMIADGWIFSQDNLSIITAKESDWICNVVTGYTEKLRILYQTSDIARIYIRRPVVATSIDIPTLQEDLIRRMVPVGVLPLDAPVPEGRLESGWQETRPRVFGALLDLLAQVLALGQPPDGTRLSELAAWGRVAWALDQLAGDGVDTVALCEQRRKAAAAGEIEADPFWDAVEDRFSAKNHDGTSKHFDGPLRRLLDLVEPGMHSHRPKTWPTMRSLPGRIERRKAGLLAAGWLIECDPGDSASHRAAVWHIYPPERPNEKPHDDGCGCRRCNPNEDSF